ncbi:hypothetical protein ACJVC5_17600 [Peredibacter sp. HCB2-198]|uniref:hypothetical protein n=1 Tax=Peredibacter sp. HCB2-198 TaxID=3383025 RepID=UPI0038B528D2
MKSLAFILLLFTTVSVKAHVEELDFITEVDEEHYKSNARLYRGEGEHQCQSPESIGHTCKNLGVNFMDCNHAFYKLKMEDCCSGSKYGGTSIAFKLTKCTNFN